MYRNVPSRSPLSRQVAASLKPGQPEVVTQRWPSGFDQQVGRLDVAVQNTQERVRARWPRPPGSPARAASPAASWPSARRLCNRPDEMLSAFFRFGQHRRQAAALDELHRVIVHALVAAHGEDGHDVRDDACAAAIWASIWNRASCLVSAPAAIGSTFRATRRPSDTWTAS